MVMRAQKHQPMIEELNTFLRGWIGYYRLVEIHASEKYRGLIPWLSKFYWWMITLRSVMVFVSFLRVKVTSLWWVMLAMVARQWMRYGDFSLMW
jgi:hypothetical protein